MHNVDIEALAARLHFIYQREAHRQGVVNHPDDYDDLSENTKEFDRVLSQWIIDNWVPCFNPTEGIPE